MFLADVNARKAHFVPVTLGIIDGEHAEVLKPALSGQVVTLGQHLLEDGSPITLPSDGAKVPEKDGPSPKSGNEAGVTRPGDTQ